MLIYGFMVDGLDFDFINQQVCRKIRKPQYTIQPKTRYTTEPCHMWAQTTSLPSQDFTEQPYWKGSLTLSSSHEAIQLAERLVEQRLVACAQASDSGAPGRASSR